MNYFSKKIFLVLIVCLCLLIPTGCKKKYSVTFETNGGNVIEAVSGTKKTVVELPTPEREGFDFMGWYLDSDLSGDKVESVTIGKKSITVFAKWEQLVNIKFELDGGSMSTNVVYAHSGDSVKQLVSGLIPTKAGCVFGGWFIGNVELGDATKVGNKDITLTAKYKAEYTINVYKQKLTLDGYDKEEIKDYEYLGKVLNPTLDIEGFSEVTKDDTVSEVVMSTDKASNVINLYFDRDVYTVYFRSNYPGDDKADEANSIKIVYGEEVDLPSYDYSYNGYYLAGWAESAGGSVVYDAHFLDGLIFNQESGDVVLPKITAKRNMSLYAVWNGGYRDMFGGDDTIFVAGDDTVYLCRGGIYFIGELYEDGTFLFYNTKDNLEGRIFDDNTFAYYNSARDEYSATLYEVGKGLNNDVKIFFDAYNGIIYKDTEGESKGSYTIDENNRYIATFTEGVLDGKTLTILIGSVNLDGNRTEAFQLRNDAEADMGTLVRFVVNNGNLTYYTSAYTIMMSGFGVLLYNTGTQYAQYYYSYDDETKLLNMTSSSGQAVGVAKIMEVNGKLGYMLYDATTDIEYVGSDGSKLTLDGTCNAVYTKGDEKVVGYYTYKASAFGGLIITVNASGKTYTFMGNTITEETVDGEKGESKNVFEVKPNGYAEYYYKNEDGTFYAPLIVLNDKEDGQVSVYGYTTTRQYLLVLEGEVSSLENGHMSFVTKSVYEADVMTSPLDISKLESAEFVYDTTSTQYAVWYWFNAVVDGTEKTWGESYTSTSGAKLFLIAGLAVYEKDGMVISGSYATKNGLTTISSSNGSVYVELDTENKTFVSLEHSPYNAYIVTKNGTYSQNEYLALDGKGNGTYVFKEVVDGETVTTEIKGKVVKTEDTTKEGSYIFTFSSEEKNFKYIMVNSNYAFVLPYYGEYYGTYTSNDGILYLDGYGYHASFTDTDGNVYSGVYSTAEENVVRITCEDGYRYFDISGKTFTFRGMEFGSYILMDNQGTPGLFLSFDGYGTAVVYKTERDEHDESVRVDIDTNGKYVIDGDKFTVTYKDGIKDVTLVGYLSTYTYGNNVYRTFVIDHEEVVQTFVNTRDWSILTLDSIGNAVKYDNKGIKETGTFMLITSGLLYYVNSESTQANIYKYDTVKGTITPSEFKARGYYTENLNSLLFSQYGFAIFNNETRYYYAMEGNNVIIYHQDAGSSEANEYGFVAENFGAFDDVKEYNGKTYYANDGYAITFSRVEETKDDYPVLVTANPRVVAPLEKLVFTPSGADTFRVSGAVTINGTDYNCTVVRELVGDEYEMYIVIGGYRFDVTATYHGKDASGVSTAFYAVTNLTYKAQYYPYLYLNTYYMIYSFLGPNYAASYENNIGMMYINRTFDKNGDQLTDLLTVVLDEGTEAFDMNGERFTCEDMEYTYENGLYTVGLTSTDGYKYYLRIQLQMHSAFGMYGYRVYGITREETLTDGNYEFSIQRIVFTETNSPIGTWFTGMLKVDGVEYDYSLIYKIDDVWHYVYRETDENGKIIKTTYYKLELKEVDGGSVDEEDNTLKPYESVKITELACSTMYAENGVTYVDVVDGKVVLLNLDGTRMAITESSYDVETSTYTIKASNGRKFTITVVDGVITVRDVVGEE